MEKDSSVQPTVLETRFCNLWRQCAIDDPEPAASAWQDLYRHYLERQRRYHTIVHVACCLQELDPVADRLDNPDAVEMAIWYHDVIYDPRTRDNELNSRRYFEKMSATHMDDQFIETVGDLIMITQHHAPPLLPDHKYMCDIDLSSFAAPWQDFLADSSNLRCEQTHLSDRDFYTGKLKFLRLLQDRDRIFFTDYFHYNCEDKARANIRQYIDLILDGHYLD